MIRNMDEVEREAGVDSVYDVVVSRFMEFIFLFVNEGFNDVASSVGKLRPSVSVKFGRRHPITWNVAAAYRRFLSVPDLCRSPLT